MVNRYPHSILTQIFSLPLSSAELISSCQDECSLKYDEKTTIPDFCHMNDEYSALLEELSIMSAAAPDRLKIMH